jgi:hypothetical protein
VTIVNWCKYDLKNLMERDPKWHVVHLLLSWIMNLFPCSMFIFHDFNSPVDCFKFNLKGLSNKVQLNSKTQVNIFVYVVDVSYGNWNLQWHCWAWISSNNKQHAKLLIATLHFGIYEQKKLQTLNLFVACNLPSSFYSLFIHVYVVGCELSCQLCSLA